MLHDKLDCGGLPGIVTRIAIVLGAVSIEDLRKVIYFEG